MSFSATLAGATAVLNLLASILNLGITTRGNQRLATSVVVQQLPGEAYKVASKLVDDIRALRTDLVNNGIDLKQTPDELEATQSWWRLRRNRIISNLHRRLLGVDNELSGLLGDLVAVAQCFEAEELIVKSGADAQAQKQQARAITDPSRPIGEIIDDVETFVDQIVAQLADMR